jgi:hypothetical protein
MARYGRRDLIGHYIEKRQKTQRPCGHACCRGYRVHPDNYPVILPDRTLRRASDNDLQAHFRQLAAQDSDQARRGEAQVLHEMDRRDQAERRKRDKDVWKRARLESFSATRAAARQEREAQTEHMLLQAEAATQGYLVNSRGRARGISDSEILTGRESVFNRYASDEARDYFAAHPRPTASFFRGRVTRVVERATEPRRPRRGVVSR